jgi:hypothetical protein
VVSVSAPVGESPLADSLGGVYRRVSSRMPLTNGPCAIGSISAASAADPPRGSCFSNPCCSPYPKSFHFPLDTRFFFWENFPNY